MGLSMIGGVNLADASSLTTGSQSLSLPVSNLLDPIVQHVWQAWAGTNSTYLLLDLQSQVDMNTVALMGINMTASGTVRVRLSTADSSGIAGNAYDSGTVPCGVDTNFKMLVHIMSQTSFYTGRYLRIDLDDSTITTLQAGRIAVLKSLQPEFNIIYGKKKGVIDGAVRTQVRSGAVYVEERFVQRYMDIDFDFLDEAEADEFHIQDLKVGLRKDVLFVGDPDSSNIGKNAVWGLLEELGEIIEPFLDIYTRQFKVVERL